MKFFPENILHQIEFDKVLSLLAAHCRTELAKEKASHLRIHTKKEFITLALNQANEFKTLIETAQPFPNDFTRNIARELKLLGIPGSVLSGEQFILVKKLAENAQAIFRWFDDDHRAAFPALASITENLYYEKVIKQLIEEVLDDAGIVKDSASEELASIRMNLYRKRNELRRVFERIVSRLNKLGYLTDIEESFMNGRRVLAVYAEQKRMVKGVLHSESDSRRTSFIEPEETTELNNEIFSLEYEEEKEVTRVLKQLSTNLAIYASLLRGYFEMTANFDLVRAKALLAIDIKASLPVVHDKAHVGLINAYHPLLLLYNKKHEKPTIPVTLTLYDRQSILVISGPNAGGKTVTLKTVGLLQVMLQSGLLVSASPDSEFGIFKQMMMQIGDEQSLEFELSTYSSHLKNMKHFVENANGKTLFFIDELGSGSDPNLGGAFAEVIMEELAKKHAYGIVTTHYLNLKVMANKTPGIFNGAMQFDEQNLMPLYRLQIGKPGSSYTFSIAERIGLDKRLINRARNLVNENHYQLDKLLNKTEQDLQKIATEKGQLQQLMKENDNLRKELNVTLNKERHRQEVERLREQNKISEAKLSYLKEMDRKLKAAVNEWRRADDKTEAVKTLQALLFGQKQKMVTDRQQRKLNEKYAETEAEIAIGTKVKMIKNRQVGVVKELRGKKAIVQLGVVPITVSLDDLVAVVDVAPPAPSENKNANNL